MPTPNFLEADTGFILRTVVYLPGAKQYTIVMILETPKEQLPYISIAYAAYFIAARWKSLSRSDKFERDIYHQFVHRLALTGGSAAMSHPFDKREYLLKTSQSVIDHRIGVGH